MEFFSRLFKKKKTVIQGPPPVPQKEDVEAIAKEEALKKRQRITRTILTGPRGLETEAEVTRKTLLGE